MRRKSERTASKKAKPSPEKKLEKPKRTRSKRTKKQSTSSENESADEGSPVRESAVEVEVKPPTTPVKEVSPEEAADQVWQVKTAQGSSETGEIQKLKICLTRPPSTPERVDRSPRSKRKHARATSSSDTPSGDGSEEKKRKHRSRRSTRESNDDASEINQESQSDEPEKEQTKSSKDVSKKSNDDIHCVQVVQPSNQLVSDDTPMSTTTDDNKSEIAQSTEKDKQEVKTTKTDEVSEDKTSDADTTVASPKQTDDKQTENNTAKNEANSQCHDNSAVQETETENIPVTEKQKKIDSTQGNIKEAQNELQAEEDSTEDKVSKVKELIESEQVPEISQGKDNKVTNDIDVVEKQSARQRTVSADSNIDADDSHRSSRTKDLDQSECIQSTHDEPTSNGQAASTPIIINRKRRWGSRPSKVTTQKSITISTDVLKDIIPDVKPAEFEEVIEEKKHHKRVDMNERIERPILPKIIIDNTENVVKRDQEDKENLKIKEALPLSNRKISIVRDDDIITRPPSPPRHKQSSILYITNLVRPFTLAQLKNLLQRTGRIVENGFWIDRIKSRCYVIYENEDQAVETRHALHGVTWPVSNPKALQVDFSSQEAFDKAKANEDTENTQTNSIPGTVEDWLREQDMKREHGELDKPWERKTIVREWDVGKGDKPKDDKMNNKDDRLEKRRHRTPERSPEPAKKFKKKEEEAPAKLLDDLFRKTKTTPCIYWLPLSAETIAVKEEQRRQHMAEHERRLHELRRHRRH